MPVGDGWAKLCPDISWFAGSTNKVLYLIPMPARSNLPKFFGVEFAWAFRSVSACTLRNECMPLIKQLSVEHSGHLCLIQPENQLLEEYNSIEMNGIFIASGKYSLHLTAQTHSDVRLHYIICIDSSILYCFSDYIGNFRTGTSMFNRIWSNLLSIPEGFDALSQGVFPANTHFSVLASLQISQSKSLLMLG